MGQREWTVEVDGSSHRVHFEHHWFSGKRAVSLDDQPLGETGWNLVDAGGHLDFTVGDHRLRIATATNGLSYRHTLLVDGRVVDALDRARLTARVARLLVKRGRALGGWRCEVVEHPVPGAAFTVFRVDVPAAPFHIASTVGLDELHGSELLACAREDGEGAAGALGVLAQQILRTPVGTVVTGEPLSLPFYGQPGCFLTEPPPHWIHGQTLKEAWRCWAFTAVPLTAEELVQASTRGIHPVLEARVAAGAFAWVDAD